MCSVTRELLESTLRNVLEVAATVRTAPSSNAYTVVDVRSCTSDPLQV
jgi:hypothetical protein